MAFALVANVQKTGGSSGGTSGAIDTTGANLIVIHVAQGEFTASPVAVSDSKGNTWNALTAASEPSIAGGLSSRLYWAGGAGIVVGTGHTFTTAGTSVFPTVGVQAWSGAHATSPFDQQNAHVDAGTTGTPGSITPSENNCLVISGTNNHDNASTITINSSMTISNQAAFGPADHYSGAMAYLVQTSAAAINPTWTSDNSRKSSTIASFKSSGGGGGGGQRCQLVIL